MTNEIEVWIKQNSKKILNLWAIYTEHNIVNTDEEAVFGASQLTIQLDPPFEDLNEFVHMLWVYLILNKLKDLDLIEETNDGRYKRKFNLSNE